MHLPLNTKIYASVFVPMHSPVIHSIHCMLHFHYALYFIKRGFCARFFLSVLRRGNWKSAGEKTVALIRCFVENKPWFLMEFWGIIAQMQNEQITIVIRIQLFSNGASRCCFESSIWHGKGTISCQEVSSHHLLGSCVFLVRVQSSLQRAAWWPHYILFVYGSPVTWY